MDNNGEVYMKNGDAFCVDITGKPTWKVVVYLAWIITRKST